MQSGHLDAAADALGLDAIVVMPDGDDGFYVDSPAPIDYDACIEDGTGLFFARRDRHGTCVHENAYETYIARISSATSTRPTARAPRASRARSPACRWAASAR